MIRHYCDHCGREIVDDESKCGLINVLGIPHEHEFCSPYCQQQWLKEYILRGALAGAISKELRK